MTTISIVQRNRIAHEAIEVVEGRVAFRDFHDALSEEELDDDLVDELVDLIEHEPKVGGFLGASVRSHEKYMARVHEIICLLQESTQ